MIRRLCAAALLALAIPFIATAQSWRTFDAARQLHDTSAIAVHVMYGAGRVTLKPEKARNLFEMHLKYDAERAEPMYQFDRAAAQVMMGVRQRSGIRSMRGDNEGSELSLNLSPSAPMRLQLDVGAAEGDYDLSGLQLDEFGLKTGATESHVRFDAPNPRRMRALRIEMGAASVNIDGLGNANAEQIDVNLGVGHLAMDFGGEWRGDVAMTVTSALGSVTVAVPNDIGIRVESSKFLSSFEGNGLVNKNGAWETENFNSAKHKLRVRSTGVLGQFSVTRQPK